PFMVHLRLRHEKKEVDPVTRRVRPMTADEIVASFKTFVKDRPTRAFVEYRRRMRSRFPNYRRKVLRQENARTIALSLMAFDYRAQFGNLSDLPRRLSLKEKSLFARGNRALGIVQFVKALHKALDRIHRLMERIRPLA